MKQAGPSPTLTSLSSVCITPTLLVDIVFVFSMGKIFHVCYCSFAKSFFFFFTIFLDALV